MKGIAVATVPTVPTVQVILECIESVVVTRDSSLRLGEDSPLSEHLDSFSLVQLVVALEDRFSVAFSQAELLDAPNWKTARSILSLLDRKRTVKAA